MNFDRCSGIVAFVSRKGKNMYYSECDFAEWFSSIFKIEWMCVCVCACVDVCAILFAIIQMENKFKKKRKRHKRSAKHSNLHAHQYTRIPECHRSLINYICYCCCCYWFGSVCLGSCWWKYSHQHIRARGEALRCAHFSAQTLYIVHIHRPPHTSIVDSFVQSTIQFIT